MSVVVGDSLDASGTVSGIETHPCFFCKESFAPGTKVQLCCSRTPIHLGCVAKYQLLSAAEQTKLSAHKCLLRRKSPKRGHPVAPVAKKPRNFCFFESKKLNIFFAVLFSLIALAYPWVNDRLLINRDNEARTNFALFVDLLVGGILGGTLFIVFFVAIFICGTFGKIGKKCCKTCNRTCCCGIPRFLYDIVWGVAPPLEDDDSDTEDVAIMQPPE